MTRARETGRWLAVLALFLLLVALPVASPAQECRISVNTSFDQLYPDISGSRIVWQDSNDNNLRLFDLSTGIETELTAGSNQHTLPVIDGPLVAWLENPFAPYQVTLLNLTAGTTRILSASGYSPDISGDRVIWQDSGGTPGIALFNSADGSQGMVVTGPSDQTQPAISGDMVTWVNGSSSEQIYGKSLSTGDETLVAQTSCSNPPCIIDTAISGNRVAWSDYRDDFDRDLYFTDSGSLVEKLVADYPVDQTSPAIDGDRIVWMNGTDLWLGDLTGANPSVPITAGSGNYRPKISGDRIVWYKDVGGKKDIYLETVGSSLACPGAAYTANTTSGLSPLTVQFTDTSTGSPGHWLWEFGDGTTSTDENPVHTFASDGSYSIALTVSSPVGRDYTTRADSIRVGPVPMVSFTVNQTYGIAPLPARFTDTSSGSPTGWSWDFGDGATSADRNPTHTYLAPGNYTV
ncbi:MAG TPA: PKD domain-containing protein, partial [Methanomicrobiales archaeon]|nr:PKD domain-containing protein [Methanomicrobiales archaeon]